MQIKQENSKQDTVQVLQYIFTIPQYQPTSTQIISSIQTLQSSLKERGIPLVHINPIRKCLKSEILFFLLPPPNSN